MEFFFIIFYDTLLHLACESGNLELVKYLISLNKIDIKSTNILNTLFLIMFFENFFVFIQFK